MEGKKRKETETKGMKRDAGRERDRRKLGK